MAALHGLAGAEIDHLEAPLQAQLAVAGSQPSADEQLLSLESRQRVFVASLANRHAAIEALVVANAEPQRPGMVPRTIFTPDDITGVIRVAHAIDVGSLDADGIGIGRGEVPVEISFGIVCFQGGSVGWWVAVQHGAIVQQTLESGSTIGASAGV